MTQLKNIILIVISLLVVISSCKKNSARSCLLSHNGNWQIVSYEVNGHDSSNYLDRNDRSDGSNMDIIISKSKVGPHPTNANFSLKNKTITYNFSLSNEELVFFGWYWECYCNHDPAICNPMIFMPENTKPENTTRAKWNIIKLTNNELIIECVMTNTYLIKLRNA